MFRSLLTVLVVLAGTTSARLALAEDPEALLKRGVELRRIGQDVEALDLFKRAYALSPSPRAIAQVGLAEQALGQWADAEAHVRQALAVPADPWIAKNRPALDASLATIAQHLGSLEVLGGPAGAEVLLDGRVVGKLPLSQTLRVATGTVPVEIRAKGYLPVVRIVTVAADELTRESVTLQPEPTVRRATARPLPQPETTMNGTAALPAGPTPPRPPVGPARTAAWATLLGGAAFAAAGATALMIREVDARNYNANCIDLSLDMSQRSQCHDWQTGGNTARKVAIGTLVTAGALGIASGVLFYATSRPDAGSRFALSCAPTAPSVGLRCAARF